MNCGECANTLKARDGFPNQVFCTIHHWHNGEREDASRCSYFKKKPITNADRIRAMTDEELANLFFKWTRECDCNDVPCREYCCLTNRYDCVQNWLDWLKQEAVE